MSKRHHTAIAAASESSSEEEEEDAFTKISCIASNSNTTRVENTTVVDADADTDACKNDDHLNRESRLVENNVSQIKVEQIQHNSRGHHYRKARLDAILQDIQTAKEQEDFNVDDYHVGGFVNNNHGSHCIDEEEEQLTTNVFVGNLDPSITEEQLTDLFRKYGDLYSVKIMWPRTDEERARRRNTGFVCFVEREDASNALDELNEVEDPWGTGRRLTLGWGKNVKKIVRKGTGGVIIKGRRKRRSLSEASKLNNNEKGDRCQEKLKKEEYDISNTFVAVRDLPSAINVIVPSDPSRVEFIGTIASFVAKDGSSIERHLIERESLSDPKFAFLNPSRVASETILEEHIFYRWRVYSYCQGDLKNSWRTKPFKMFKGGRWWIPPPLIDREAAKQEEEEAEKIEESIIYKKEGRKKIDHDAEINTNMKNRLAEQKRHGGTIKLTPYEKEKLGNVLKRIVATRESICEAMAFCFDKSGSAYEIAESIKDLLTSSASSVDTRIALLYLLSDVLFNSQQPGVRNAFKYRDAIESTAKDVFERIGKAESGRMTMNKLRRAVKRILGAWSHWSVYTHEFIDELEARFEGRPYVSPAKEATIVADIVDEVVDDEVVEEEIHCTINNEGDETKRNKNVHAINNPKGGWKDVDNLSSNVPSSEVNLVDLIDDELDGELITEEELQSLRLVKI